MIAVKDVEEAAARLVPKSGLKARFALLKKLLPPAREKTADPQCVEPESLHFHGLADMGRYDPIGNFGVHPCELNAWLAMRASHRHPHGC